jgi:hypothetical protein
VATLMSDTGGLIDRWVGSHHVTRLDLSVMRWQALFHGSTWKLQFGQVLISLFSEGGPGHEKPDSDNPVYQDLGFAYVMDDGQPESCG